MRRALPLALLLAFSCSILMAADIEITPMYGYRWGGDLEADSSKLFAEDVEIDGSGAYGLLLGIRAEGGFIIEVSANRQESRFIDSDTLFGGANVLFDVDTTYYHVGAGYYWTLADGEFEPFVTGSLGVAHINPDTAGAESAKEFSTSIGGGIKVWANPHFGFRFELRGFWANTGDSDDCDVCVWEEFTDDLYQGEARVGIIARF